MARRVLALILLGLALIVCVALAASESLTNRTGRTATAVTVAFSEQVRITSYDETIFPTKEPSSRSATFRFSGGQLENGARFSVSWTPSTAEITNTEWETTGAASSASTGSSAPLTYEQIMAQIAHYPGPDEPLYVPVEGEQVWLTDLEGHADIYDNDSIKINYAPGFDKSQITRIDVYRNGVKMRFLPALFDVLTNEQMKTFDGNPAENTPKSSHTDHAIMGYLYSLRFFRAGIGTAAQVIPATVQSAIKWHPAKRYVHIDGWWYTDIALYMDPASIVRYCEQVRADGFNGVTVSVNYYLAGPTASDVSAQYIYKAGVTDSLQRTATTAELGSLLASIEESGLGIELRGIVNVAVGVPHEPCFSCISPRNLSGFFLSYAELLAKDLGAMAAQYHVDYLTPFTEMGSLEPHSGMLGAFYGQLDATFAAHLGFEEPTHAFLSGGNCGCTEGSFLSNVGSFWDWTDEQGRPLAVVWSGWGTPMETQNDQRLSVMAPAFVHWWSPALTYYRDRYARNELTFGELGVYNADGAANGIWWELARQSRLDEQEVADIWAAYLLGCAAMGLDGFVAWDVPLWGIYGSPPWGTLNPGDFAMAIGSAAYRIIKSIIGP